MALLLLWCHEPLGDVSKNNPSILISSTDSEQSWICQDENLVQYLINLSLSKINLATCFERVAPAGVFCFLLSFIIRFLFEVSMNHNFFFVRVNCIYLRYDFVVVLFWMYAFYFVCNPACFFAKEKGVFANANFENVICICIWRNMYEYCSNELLLLNRFFFCLNKFNLVTLPPFTRV